MLKNVQGAETTGPFYIWANEDCANKEDDFEQAKRVRLKLIADGSNCVYIVDPDGVEVVDADIVTDECNRALNRIDGAMEHLLSVLDHSGSLEGENTQRAAYALRLEVVRAIGDQGRIEAAEASLASLAVTDPA